MKRIFLIIALSFVGLLTTSCFDKQSPNYQFFPNMYHSVGYETYAESSAFNDSVEAQIPVVGTIKRGFVPYEYPNTTEGYTAAKATSKSPLVAAEIDMQKTKELYTIYCAICHGETGNGKGNLVLREKYLGVPNYKDREITEGSVYHVLTYGLNAMGSYANQLSQKERWQVSAYVLKLKSEL